MGQRLQPNWTNHYLHKRASITRKGAQYKYESTSMSQKQLNNPCCRYTNLRDCVCVTILAEAKYWRNLSAERHTAYVKIKAITSRTSEVSIEGGSFSENSLCFF